MGTKIEKGRQCGELARSLRQSADSESDFVRRRKYIITAYFKVNGILLAAKSTWENVPSTASRPRRGQRLGPSYSPAHVTDVILRPINVCPKKRPSK